MGHPTRPPLPIGLVAAVAALALLAPSCGSGDRDARAEEVAAAWRVVDDEVETVAPSTMAGAGGSVTTAAPTTTSTTTTTTLVPPTPTDPPRPDPPAIGTLELPCGHRGDAAGVGVDDTRIVLGVGNDRGGLHAGASGRGVVEAVRALADHCNGLGGIAGRHVVVEEFDAAVIEVDAQMARACETVFALVGHAYLWDDAAETTRLECGLPAFPAWSPGVGDAGPRLAAGMPSTPLPAPNRGNLLVLATSPEVGGRVALVGPDTTGGRNGRATRAVGLGFSDVPVELVADLGYAVAAEPDWDAIVAEARRSGAGVVDFVGACRSALVPFLRAAAAVDWTPAVVAGPDAYDPDCLAGAEPGLLDRVLLEMALLPVEDGRLAPATAELTTILEPLGVPVTGDSLRAASSFLLWAEAAAACGARLDRDCVVERALAIDEWTAGGLHAPTDPGASAMAPCGVLLGVEGDRYVRRLPADPGTFDCVSPDGEPGATGTGG